MLKTGTVTDTDRQKVYDQLYESAKQITETHKPVGTFPESRRRKSFHLFEPGTS